MQTFLASDVLYQARTAPLIKSALDDAEIGGQKIATSRFLPGIEWLSEQTIAAELDQQLTGGSNSKTGEPAPGLHGTGLESVSVGDTTLQPDAPNRVPASADTRVRRAASPTRARTTSSTSRSAVAIEGGDKPIKASRTVDTVAKGQTAEASIPLGHEAADRRRRDGQGDGREGARRAEDRQQHRRRTTCCSPRLTLPRPGSLRVRPRAKPAARSYPSAP